MRSKWIWALLAVFFCVAVYAGTVLATPQSNVTTSTVAKSVFDEIDLNAHTIPANIWQARLKTQGQSDVYVVDNKFAPQGTTGWHSHPGPSLIFVVSGTITNYMSDGHHCMQQDYTAGQGFVDEGGDHVHMIKNNGSAAARTIVVQFLPEGATRRIDADQPPNCG